MMMARLGWAIAASAFVSGTVQAASFDIPAQDLAPALIELGTRAKRNVLISPELAAGKRSSAVRAAPSFETALRSMLAGTGLAASFTVDGSATVVSLGGASALSDMGPALDEIVVTADRPDSFGADFVQVGTFRNARLIDTPATISVITRELLDSQGVVSLFDALRNTSGVSRSETSGATFDSLLIRGIQVDNRNSYKLNGTLSVINLLGIAIENKERIEVLKGVGALYYGFAPPSGIVNLVTKRADRDVTTVGFRAGEHGTIEASADIGRRLSDGFGVRLNGAAASIENGVANYRGERTFVSLAADWQASEALKFTADVEYSRKDATELGSITLLPAGSALAPPATTNVIILPPLVSNRTHVGGTDLATDAEGTNIILRGDLKLSDQVAFTLEGGQSRVVRDRMFASLRDYDLRPASPTFGGGTLRVTRTEDQLYRNRHLRSELAGALATGSVEHNLVVGASANERFQNGRSATPVTVPQNYFRPVDATVARPTMFTLSPNTIRDRGLYAFDRVEAGPLQVLAGIRYSSYRSRTTSATGAVTRFRFENWSPSVGVVLKPSENTSIYTTYLQGLEEVSPAPNFAANQGAVLAPATSEQYEAGVKAEAFAGLVLQIGAFRISRPSAFVDPADNVYKLAGRARFQGIEASATGELSPSFSVYLTGQYLDATIRRAAQAVLLDKTPENTPKWTASAYAEFRPEGTDLKLGGGLFHVGKRPVNSLNQAYIDGHTLLSAALGYEFKTIGRGLTVQLNGDNLTNKLYWAGAGGNVLAVGVPREVRLSARLDF
jgi:iron complex outermembrane recepter protein